MRLVDADKFEAFVIRTNGDEEFVNGVQYVLEKIDNAPTVDAIPREQIDKAIKEMREKYRGYWFQGSAGEIVDDFVDILHKYTDRSIDK